MNKTKRAWLVFIALCFLACACVYFSRSRAIVPATHATATTAGPPGTANAAWLRAGPSGYAVFSSVKEHSLAERIDLLMASGRPEDAFEAYILVRDCLLFQKNGTLPYLGFPDHLHDMTDDEAAAETRLCGVLTQPMKTARLAHLFIAAKAGVMGSDSAMLEEGPFGDRSALTNRPDDPLVVAWKRQVLELMTRRAEQGDTGSLQILAMASLTGTEAIDKNQVAALTYALAMREIYDGWGMFNRPPLKGAPYAFDDQNLAVYKTGLSQEQIALATANADTIKANNAADAKKQQ